MTTAAWSSILMGSKSDLDVMQPARDALTELGVAHEVRVLSAHRTPDALFEYVRGRRGARRRGRSSPARAGRPTCRASSPPRRPCPCSACPIPVGHLLGLDALLAIVQMPKGIPVATFAVGKAGARQRGALRGRHSRGKRPELAARLVAWRKAQAEAPKVVRVIA